MMSEDRFQFLVFCLLCILPVAGSIRHTFELFRYYDFYVDSKNPKEWYFPLNIWTEQELNVSLATDSNSSVVSVTFSICHVRSADETNLKKTVQTALVSKPNEYASLILTNLTALPIERCPINVSESMDKPFATEYGVLILRLYSQEIRGRGTLAIGPLSRSRVDEVRLLKGERLKLNLSLTENFQDAALEITVRVGSVKLEIQQKCNSSQKIPSLEIGPFATGSMEWINLVHLNSSSGQLLFAGNNFTNLVACRSNDQKRRNRAKKPNKTSAAVFNLSAHLIGMDGFNVVSIPRSSSTELTEDYSDNESAILFWLIIFVVAVILVSSISLGFYVAVKYINLRTRKRYENQRVSALGNTSNTTSLTNTDRKPPTMGRKRKVAPVKMTLPTVLFKKEKANQDGNISIITDRALTNGVSRNL